MLTAAHCLIRDPKPKLVRLGRVRFKNKASKFRRFFNSWLLLNFQTDLNLEKKQINSDSNPAVDVPVKVTF